MSNRKESLKKVANLKERHKTKELIIDLKIIIDQFAESWKTLREHILELARILDEEKLCKRDKICRAIKDILDDKIKQGKITEKWIEECLPPEYKRKYEKKSEVSALLPGEEKKMVVTTDGKTEFQNNADYINNSEKIHDDNKNIDVLGIPKESSESSQFQDTNNIPKQNNNLQVDNNSAVEFSIPKNRYEEIYAAIKICQNHIIIKLNRHNEIISIKSDVGINDDNDTKHDGDILEQNK